MSIITDIKKDITKVVDYLEKFENAISDAEPLFDIEGKRLEQLNRDLPNNLLKYKQLLKEIKYIADYVSDVYLAKISSQKYKEINEKSHRALTQREIQIYIDSDESYVETKELALEVELVKEKIVSIVEAFEQMNWSLKNITQLRINEMQDSII